MGLWRLWNMQKRRKLMDDSIRVRRHFMFILFPIPSSDTRGIQVNYVSMFFLRIIFLTNNENKHYTLCVKVLLQKITDEKKFWSWLIDNDIKKDPNLLHWRSRKERDMRFWRSWTNWEKSNLIHLVFRYVLSQEFSYARKYFSYKKMNHVLEIRCTSCLNDSVCVFDAATFQWNVPPIIV